MKKIQAIIKKGKVDAARQRLNPKETVELILVYLQDADIELTTEQPTTRDGEFDFYEKERMEKAAIVELM